MNTTEKSEETYALLPWEQYHKLEANGAAYVLPVGKDASKKIRDENPQTEVLLLPSKSMAERAVSAFNRLCAAAWTPNQSSTERNENMDVCKSCDAELELLRRVSQAPA